MDKKLLAMLTLTLFSGAALANVQTNSFENLDSNHDGYLSKQEVAQVSRPTREFDEADINKDGKFNQAEFKDYFKDTHEEVAQTGAPSFDSLDADKDGALSRNEYEAVAMDAAGHARGDKQETQDSEKQILVVPVPPGTDAVIVAPTPPSGGSLGTP